MASATHLPYELWQVLHIYLMRYGKYCTFSPKNSLNNQLLYIRSVKRESAALAEFQKKLCAAQNLFQKRNVLHFPVFKKRNV